MTSTGPGRGFTVVRRLAAPREAVFRAWTDPEQLVWFAGTTPPPEHPTTVDLRVGGVWRLWLVEQGEGGRAYVSGGIYREIVPPERLVFTWGSTDGWPVVDPSRLDDNPLVTIELRDLSDATEMTFTLDFADQVSEQRVRDWLSMGVHEGWETVLDQLPAAPGLVPAR